MSGEATKKQPEQQDPHSNDPKHGNSEQKDSKNPAHQGGQQDTQQGNQGERRDPKSGQQGGTPEQGNQQDPQHQKGNPSKSQEQSNDKSQREKH